MAARRQFTSEFKLEVAQMVVESKARISKVSQDLSIGDNLIRKWVSQYKLEQSGVVLKGIVPLTADQKRIRQLETENQSLKSDVELLKKASAFFARTIK